MWDPYFLPLVPAPPISTPSWFPDGFTRFTHRLADCGSLWLLKSPGLGRTTADCLFSLSCFFYHMEQAMAGGEFNRSRVLKELVLTGGESFFAPAYLTH